MMLKFSKCLERLVRANYSVSLTGEGNHLLCVNVRNGNAIILDVMDNKILSTAIEAAEQQSKIQPGAPTQ